MAQVAGLMVKIQADTNGLAKGLNKASRKTKAFGGQIGQLKGMLAGAFAVSSLISFGKEIVKTTSDVEEMQSKFKAVFKGLSDETMEWSEDTAAAMGRSKFALQGYLAALQDTFVPLGFARSEGAKLSKQLTQLTIDVASFQNKAEDDVLRDFQSAIVGNHETVRKYGIIITQATLDQELYNMGVEDGVKGATEAEKVMARLNVITAGTADAQGDAARTADSYANQVKAMDAALDELKVTLGTNVLPWLGRFAKEATDIVKFLSGDMSPAMIELNNRMSEFGFAAKKGASFAEDSFTSLQKQINDSTLSIIDAEKAIKSEQDTLKESITALKAEYQRLADESPFIQLNGGPLADAMTETAEKVALLEAQLRKLINLSTTLVDLGKGTDVYNVSLASLGKQIRDNNAAIQKTQDLDEAARLVLENRKLAEQIRLIKVRIGLIRDSKLTQPEKLKTGSTTLEGGVSEAVGVNIAPRDFTKEFKALQAQWEETATNIEKVSINISSIVASTFQEMAQSVGTAIGEVIAGTGGMESVFASVLKSLVGFMRALGSAMIAAGVASEAFQDLLGSGPAAIVAGIALLALSGVVAGLLKKGPSSFAEGGIVTGPTLAMVGDNPSGTEAIIPLEKFGQVFGSGGGGSNAPVVLDTRIKGSDLWIIQKRYGEKLDRYS